MDSDKSRNRLNEIRSNVFILHSYVMIASGFLTVAFTLYTQTEQIQFINLIKSLFTIILGFFNFWAIKTGRSSWVIWILAVWFSPIIYETFVLVDPTGFSVIKGLGFITILQLISIEYKPKVAFSALFLLFLIYFVKWIFVSQKWIELTFVFQNGYMEYSLMLLSIVFMGYITSKFELEIRTFVDKTNSNKLKLESNILSLEKKQLIIESNLNRLHDITANELKQLKQLVKHQKVYLNNQTISIENSEKMLNQLDNVLLTINEKVDQMLDE